MGVAAYNRGSRALLERIDRETEAPHARRIAALNALPKRQGAPRPFGDVAFVEVPGGCWALDASKGNRGRGFWFASVELAVAAFRVSVVCAGWLDGEFALFAAPSTEESRIARCK